MRKEFKSLRNFLVCQHDCHFIVLEHQIATVTLREPGGGGWYSHTLPIRVCAAQQGGDFEAPDLELGIHFRGVF